MRTWVNKQQRVMDRVHHMNANRAKLCEYRLLTDIKANGMTPAKRKRLSKIRMGLYGFDF